MAGVPVRRTVRASGFAALAGVLLFVVVGLWAVTADDGPGRPYASNVVAAGETLDVAAWSRAVIWGGGADLVPGDVTCTVTKRDGRTEPLELRAPEPRPTTEVLDRSGGATTPGPGPTTMVELTEADHLVGEGLTCSGGGLEAFAPGEVRLGPPLRVVGIGFFVLAGVAAVWAAVALASSRPRRAGEG